MCNRFLARATSRCQLSVAVTVLGHAATRRGNVSCVSLRHRQQRRRVDVDVSPATLMPGCGCRCRCPSLPPPFPSACLVPCAPVRPSLCACNANGSNSDANVDSAACNFLACTLLPLPLPLPLQLLLLPLSITIIECCDWQPRTRERGGVPRLLPLNWVNCRRV